LSTLPSFYLEIEPIMSLAKVAQDFFEGAGLAGSRGVVAVSGGPDSVALGHALTQLLREGFFQGLILAHVNHQLRGEESDADESFVNSLMDVWPCSGLAIRATRVNVAERAREHGENLEKMAREIRYQWLTQVAEEEKAGWVATGHSAEDQAETVLHRLLRGSGLQGLGSIYPRRALAKNVELVRPLLTVRRQEILAYLQEKDQPYCLDSTNLDQQFTRNRLRLHLLPLLTEEYQPALVDILGRLANQARAVQEELRVLSEDLLRQAELPRAGDVIVFALERLWGVSPHRTCEMFRLVWQREKWPMNGMDHKSWLRLVDLVEDRLQVHDFPGRIRARRREHVLQIGPV
jgi:tRNA(Ile)-lysidine synthase